MTANDFKKAVEAKAPKSLDPEAVSAAVAEFITLGKVERYHISDCIQRAGALEVEASEALEAERWSLPPGVLPAAQTQEIISASTSEVEDIRRDLFGSEKAPYKDYRAAVRWMKREAASQTVPTEKDLKRARALEGEIVRLIQDVTTLTRSPSAYSSSGPLQIQYVEGGRAQFLKTYGGKLGKLAERSSRLANRTGLNEAAIVAWILAGLEPTFPGARLQVTARPLGNIAIRKATLEIWDPSASLEPLLKRVRKDLKAYGPSLRQRVLLDVLKQLGDIDPGEEKQEYWERVRLEYNKRSRHIKALESYANWWSPMRAFERLDPVLKRDYPELQKKRRG